MTAAPTRNATTALTKSPYENLLLLIVNVSEEKSGLPNIAATSGVTRSLTKAVTTAPNATPITTPTARSTTLPLSRNVLKPLMTDRSPYASSETDSTIFPNCSASSSRVSTASTSDTGQVLSTTGLS